MENWAEIERAADLARDRIIKAVLLVIFATGVAALTYSMGHREGHAFALTPTPGKEWLCVGDVPDMWTCVPYWGDKK